MERIADGVWRLGSEMVSWYLVEDEGRLTAVDAGLRGFAGTLEADLASIGFTPADVEAVVLTHSDADHTGVAPVLQRAGARVLVHSDDDATLRRPRLKGGDAGPQQFLRNAWRPSTLQITAHVLRRAGGRPLGVRDAETFADGDVLDVPGGLRAVHTPGHTPGHCVLLAPRHRVLFAGDQLCTHPVLTGDGAPALMPRFFNVDDGAARAALERVDPLDGLADLVCVGTAHPFRRRRRRGARLGAGRVSRSAPRSTRTPNAVSAAASNRWQSAAPTVPADADARRERLGRDDLEVLLAAEVELLVRHRAARRVDVGVLALADVPSSHDEHAERHRALVRHGGDPLGVVEDRQRLERRAEHEHLAAGLARAARTAPRAVASSCGWSAVSHAGTRADGDDARLGVEAAPRARPGADALGHAAVVARGLGDREVEHRRLGARTRRGARPAGLGAW